MEEAHRKIELQSNEDLAYLLDNVRRAAQDQLDKAFPQIEGSSAQEDELRAPIERLVNEVRTQIHQPNTKHKKRKTANPEC